VKFELNCKEVSRLLSQGQEETLPAPDRARLRLHMVMCDACRNVDEQMAFLRKAMQAMGRDDPPKP
jgi:predicted anti-sigma-YlaC factor YlaD